MAANDGTQGRRLSPVDKRIVAVDPGHLSLGDLDGDGKPEVALRGVERVSFDCRRSGPSPVAPIDSYEDERNVTQYLEYAKPVIDTFCEAKPRAKVTFRCNPRAWYLSGKYDPVSEKPDLTQAGCLVGFAAVSQTTTSSSPCTQAFFIDFKKGL